MCPQNRGRLISHGAPLGATRDPVYSSTQVKLETGDVLLWYPDGLSLMDAHPKKDDITFVVTRMGA